MKIKAKNTTVTVGRFDPLIATEEEWGKYYSFRKQKHAEENPNDPLSSDDSFKTAITANVQYPEAEIYLYTIIDTETNTQIGDVDQAVIRDVSPSYEAAKHLLQFSIYLLPEYRRQGIGTEILKMVIDEATKREKVLLMTGSDTEDGKAFLKAIGAKTALAGLENRLVLADVDWSMIEQWVANGPNKSPTSKVEVYTSIPDEIIEEFCKVATEIVNQQPLGDLEIGEMITTPESFRQQEKMFTDMGRDWITMLAREADGSISGLTDMRYNPGRETMISQGLTGVQESYRGRGLGKWLKASMLLKIKNDYPQVKIVSTTNATTNAPMISINDRLGFKVHKETISAQIPVEQLKQKFSMSKK